MLKVIRQHEYLPNAAARLMKTNRSGTVAVVVASLSNPLYPTLLQLLVEQLALRGYRTTVWELAGAMDEATALAVAQSSVDGVIFATATDDARDMLDKVAADKPVVLVNRSVSTNDFDTVVSDNRAGGYLVARHFLAASRRHIGLISAHSQASTIREREEGFAKGLQEGIAPSVVPMPWVEPLERFNAFTYENGYRAMCSLLASHQAVDSVFCTNDIMAIGAVDAARRLGRRIPDDLWIVGYDDIPMARWDCIGLSTIQQPLDAMAKCVVERLDARIADPTLLPERFVLSNALVVRRTTA